MANIIEITDFHAPELDAYARLTEAQLRNRLEPEKGIFIAESTKVIGTALDAGYQPRSFLMERKHITGQAAPLLARFPEVPVYTAEREILEQLTGYTLTRGILCAMARPKLPSVEGVCAGARRIAVLEGIVDSTNVGAIFRSAADWPHPGIDWLHDLGFKTAAMALSDDSVSLDDPALASEEKLAIILGTEGDGLCQQTIADCDYTVMIPMSHGVDSLNVAAASAVAFWQLRIK